MDFSLFYFADDAGGDRYRLLMDGARFADEHGFAAVWTPERHFHPFGGGYPNPAVTGAAIAAITSRVDIRAGSVVAPLHHPARIAEEWAVVDNLSGGRAGVSFASGWHARDFALNPDTFAERTEVMVRAVETVRDLWSGKPVEFTGGDGEPVEVRTYPTPLRGELPVWITAAGNPRTFRTAGELGAGLLTHLLGQSLGELRDKIGLYRAAHPGTGHVVLMLHTFLGPDRDEVREIVREPFSAYLRSSVHLLSGVAGPGAAATLSEDDVDYLVARAFDRYFDTGGLFGTVADGMTALEILADIGVDEVACLIDFVGDDERVLAALPYLAKLRDAWGAR